MPEPFLSLKNLSFGYPSATKNLFERVNVHFPVGWTGIVGANGVGKTTLMRLAVGLLEPDSGKIAASGQAVYCEQRTDAPPCDFAVFLADSARAAVLWKSRLGIEQDWLGRWETLSHGERKRAQIATALWKEPDILALDEPSNHIDAETRDLLAEALEDFRGVGLLVSHDRDLLDRLCEQCLFIDPPEVAMRNGGVSIGLSEDRRERDAARADDDNARHALERLGRERQRRKEEAEQSFAKSTFSGIKKNDNDAREKMRRGQVTGRDVSNSKKVTQLAGRMKHAEKDRESIRVKKEYETGIWLEADGYSQRAFVFKSPASSIMLGDARKLVFPELAIRPQDKIALTGPNGAGKSTLVQYILEHLNLEPDKVVYVPQEVTADEASALAERVRNLDNAVRGRLMTCVSRLGSRPGRLAESSSPSPGEVRKLMLAMGIARNPHLIVMDEPTNHMDLPSIECLEEALQGCPCALLMVSHDHVFLSKITEIEWHIEADGSESRLTIGYVAGT